MSKIQVIIFVVIITFLIHCNTSHKSTFENMPVYGDILKISCLASLEHLDPHKIFFQTDKSITSIFYETMTKFSSEKQDSLVPCLAEKWKISNDGKKIKFYLRINVYFHDDPCFEFGKGRQFKSDDLIFSFMRLANPATKSIYYNLFSDKIEGLEAYHEGESDSISGVKKIDDFVVEFSLTKAHVSFLKLMAVPGSSIIPFEAVEYYKDNFSKHPVGTGAFRLVKWNNLKNLQLVRNDNYWQKDRRGNSLPYLDGIHIELLSNEIVRETKLLNNQIDILGLNEIKYKNYIKNEEFVKNLNIALINDNVYTVRFWAFSTNNGSQISNNVNIRKAIAINFNRNDLNTATINDSKLAQSFAPAIIFPEYNEKWYEYNPEKAKLIIHECVEQDLEKPIIISTNLKSKDLEFLEKSLKELGLNYKIDFRQVGYYKNIFENKPDIFRIAFSPNYPDLEEYYGLFYSKNIGTTNITEYKNDKFDLAYEQALGQKNKQKRAELFIEMENMLKVDIPALYFCNLLKTYYLSPIKIKGLKTSFNILDYNEVWIERPDEI